MRYDPWMRLKEDFNPILADLQGAFNDREIIELTTSISLMNALNRLRVSLGDKD